MDDPKPQTAPAAPEREARPAREPRQYPAFYEKAVPIALGVIGVALILMLLVILMVVLKLI
jgi:hypothetical protein